MSGLLRRIKRSRAADAGEAPAEGQAAAPEGAPTTAATAAGEAARMNEAIQPTAPLPRADPNVPAGLDPVEAAAQPPAGRRGRLRRRLRYLRRARELMLRDLGGLLYEVHRTGGGDVGAHATVIGAKVERLLSLDSEAGAIETALGAPRSEAVVFQPGVGGTCDFCGELYGSAARFCSQCGSPTGSAVRATPAHMPAPRPVPAMPKPPAAATTGERPTRVLAGEPTGSADESKPPADEVKPPADEAKPPADETPADEAKPPADEINETADAAKPPADETTPPADEAARNPLAGMSNGRAEDGTPPELSPGDPLATRERS